MMISWLTRGVVLLLAVLMTVACSPTHDWREFSAPEPAARTGLKVTFPAKPVVVSRPQTLESLPVALTLQAARVEDLMFALGVAKLEAPWEGERLTLALQAAMLRNLGLDPANASANATAVQRLEAPLSPRSGGVVAAQRLAASGKIEGEAAELRMRTWISDGFVFELLVVGPKAKWSDDVAELFLNSAVLP